MSLPYIFQDLLCFVLYKVTISGERLQDHWSSGIGKPFYRSGRRMKFRDVA